jgi:hypothetical protein
MSVWGQSLPKWAIRATSAFPPIATIERTSHHVRFVPKAEVGSASYGRTMDHQLLDKRKPDPERRAAVSLISCRYEPMVRFNNGARDGQPHAHAFRLAGEKRFEDLF